MTDIRVGITQRQAINVKVSGTVSPRTEHYTHIQSVASDMWLVTHNLGFNPAVTVISSNGDSLEVTPAYNANMNQLILNFSQAFSGKAYLS